MLKSILPPCRHISLSCIMDFDIKLIRQRIQFSPSCASCCHCCNVDFVFSHIVTCYTNPLFSCTHVNTADLLNVTCTLVATGMILGRLECNLRCTIGWIAQDTDSLRKRIVFRTLNAKRVLIIERALKYIS